MRASLLLLLLALPGVAAAQFGATGSLSVMENRDQVRWHAPAGARIAVTAPGTRDAVVRR